MAINGEFKNESRWISRAEFYKLKDVDPYVALCFSFGNDVRSYAYSPNNERIKEIYHKLCFSKTTLEVRSNLRMLLKQINKDDYSLNMQNIERLERLQRLAGLKVETINKSYESVEIPTNSVVYCDIPYKGTNKYRIDFNYDKFYDWCRNSDQTIYISEYQMPSDFEVVAQWNKTCALSQTNHTKTVEKLFKIN